MRVVVSWSGSQVGRLLMPLGAGLAVSSNGGEPAVAHGANRRAPARGVGPGAVDEQDGWGVSGHRRRSSSEALVAFQATNCPCWS
jgi:hypothetical protein